MRIGFIGLGRMGFALTGSLLRNRHDVIAYDINEDALRRLGEQGAVAAQSVAEVCRNADLVFTMLPGPRQVREVALGSEGVLRSLRQGAIYIDMSTVDVATVDAVAQAASAAGVAFGDAPVGRLAAHADRGESLFMLGIDAALRDRVDPVLMAMGTTVLYCGEAGSGTRTKLVNNLMVLVYCQVNSEALVLAKALGLDLANTLGVLTGTTAMNGQLKQKWPEKVLRGDLSPGFDLALGLKDLTLASDAARQAGVALPVGDVVRSLFQLAARAGHVGQDTSSMTDFWAAANALEPLRLPRDASETDAPQ